MGMSHGLLGCVASWKEGGEANSGDPERRGRERLRVGFASLCCTKLATSAEVGPCPLLFFVTDRLMSTEHPQTSSEKIEEQVAPLATRVAQRVECELAYVKYLFEHSNWVLRVVIDRNGGVNVDHCAKVSRQLSALLDVEDFISAAYTLEVSSPGLDKELLVAADFKKYAGQRIRIQTVEGPEGSTTLRGKLRGLNGGNVLLDDEGGGRLELPRASIAEARLELEI